MQFGYLILLFILVKLADGQQKKECQFISNETDLCVYHSNVEMIHQDASSSCSQISLTLLNIEYYDDIINLNNFLYKNSTQVNKVYWLNVSSFLIKAYELKTPHLLCPFLNVTMLLNNTEKTDRIGFGNCSDKFIPVCSKFEDAQSWNYQIGSCNEGFSRFRNKCYKKVSNVTQLDWPAAEKECMNLGGHLVSITNKFVQSFITVLMGDSSTSFGHAWIGLHFNYTNRRWQWVGSGNKIRTGNSKLEASLRSYANWKIGEPSYGVQVKTNEECGMIYQRLNAHGQWNDQHCSTKLNGYICENALESTKSARPTRLTDALSRGNCTEPFVSYEDSCWFVDSSTNASSLRTLEAAQKYCQSLSPKATLASLHSVQEYALLDVLLDQRESSSASTDAEQLLLWIGLKVSQEGNQWQLTWSDKTDIPSSQTFKKKVSPALWKGISDSTLSVQNFTHAEICVAMTAQCQFFQFYSCNDTQTRAITTCHYITHEHTAHPSIKCPSSWKPLGLRCVKVLESTKKNFHEADQACKSEGYPGAGLVTIHKSAENSAISEMVKLLSQPVWLGLRYNYSRFDDDVMFYWTRDSQPVDYLNFRAGEPSRKNMRGNEELCVEFILRNGVQYGEWNDIDCNKSRHYPMCEFEPQSNPTMFSSTSSVQPKVTPSTKPSSTSSVQPTVTPSTKPSTTSSVQPSSPDCKEPNVLTEGHFQYTFNRKFRMSWYNAKDACGGQGATLYTPQQNEIWFSTALITWLTKCFNLAELRAKYPPNVSVRAWIGLSETTFGASKATPRLKDKFFWIDGIDRPMKHWQPIDEDALGTRKCVAFDLHNNQQLYQESCSCDLHYFICKKSIQADSSNMAAATANAAATLSSSQDSNESDLVCPEAWIMRRQNGKFYCYHVFHEAKTFREAELQCASGGFLLGQQDYHLASYADIAERLWLVSLTQPPADSATAVAYNLNTVRSARRHFWLGLRMGGAAAIEQDRNGSSTPTHLWCFTDDTHTTEFAHHFFSQEGGLCAAIDASGYPQTTGIVSSFSCSLRMPFVCKGRAYVQPAASKVGSKSAVSQLNDMRDSIPRYVGGTCVNNSPQRGSKCYQIQLHSDNWQAAKELCRVKNMDLLVLDNAFEVAWLVSWMDALRLASPDSNDAKHTSVWLALNVKNKRVDGSDWRWENGASMRYSNWPLGEPILKKEHDCVVMRANLVVSHFTSDMLNYRMQLQPCAGTEKRLVICSSELDKNQQALPERKNCRNASLESTEYRGTMDKTASGSSCMRWDILDYDLANMNKKPLMAAWPQLDPGGPAASAAECRNPDNSTDGLWCWVKPDGKKTPSRELCNVPRCQLSASNAQPHGAMLTIIWPILFTVLALSVLLYLYWRRRRSRNANYGFIPYHRQNDLDPTFGGTSFHNPIYSPANA